MNQPNTLLFKEAFTDWLKSKEPTAIVGMTVGAYACPLATYLYEKTGTEYAVCQSFYVATKTNDRIEMPEWGAEFIARVDTLLPLRDDVTASQALECIL